MSETRSAGSSSGSPLRTFADGRGEDLGCGKLFIRWPADVGRSSGQDVDVVHRPPEAGTSDDETVEVGDRATRRGAGCKSAQDAAGCRAVHVEHVVDAGVNRGHDERVTGVVGEPEVADQRCVDDLANERWVVAASLWFPP